ncbi:hypothetical protein J5837_03140 [Pseudoxanthomonas helianthi]|uniref:Uncharacterized protein n=1 Tax=Pseudoxanthomonas helianthi TaxID=1453541 RepID=A0A940WYM6_9GAMM|nr:hypothetical protein [Pseudoxanthomonas helianthi]MBP3983408.1 hypothetical protein [Pseudoxanthomonas helianthi]
MAHVRLRATGPRSGFEVLVIALHGLEGVQSVEEVADLMPHLDDEDSSSAGLVDDAAGAGLHALEIEVSPPFAETVRTISDEVAARQGLVLEYVDDF